MNSDKICIKINEYGISRIIYVEKGTELKKALQKEGISINMPCGGMGACGNCKVKFLEGAPDVQPLDSKFFNEKELSEGYRLLCRCSADRDCVIVLEQTCDDISAEAVEISDKGGSGDKSSFTYGVAVDLGTTTIAAALIRHTDSGEEVVQSESTVNHQKSYGADVISRISAAEDKEALCNMKELVGTDIENLIKELKKRENLSKEQQLSVIAIAGNTTMMHLLMGRDVEGLGKYPYTPKTLAYESFDAQDIFKDVKGAEVVLLPGISAFVGADIVAGLSYIFKEHKIKIGEEKALFVDLGTNGEMAFYDGDDLMVSSTAAGPVFEAAHISCGMPSVPGAICHVKVEPSGKDKAGCNHFSCTYKTIGDKKPSGLCGSGVMELISSLVGAGIVDETGLLSDEYFDEGFPVTEDGAIRLLQEDIRNVQMAKAAIFSGMKALLKDKHPDRVYVAGGFGSSLSFSDIKNLQMFPEEFNDNIETVGNSSLKGTAEFVKSFLKGEEFKKEAKEKVIGIAGSAQVVELSQLDTFDEDYIAAMNF